MAQNYVGRITAMLTARDVNFHSTLGQAKEEVKNFGATMSKTTTKALVDSRKLTGGFGTAANFITSNIGGLLGGISVLGAAYTTISQVSQSIERLGTAADSAAKLGMSSMPEFLQGLQYHAKLVGVEADSVTSSLSKLFRTVAEARAGSKADQDILATLGLSASSLGGMTPDKVVLRVADALDQVADAGERARLAVALFGKSGGDMVNVLRGGSAAVAGGLREADSLGVARTATELQKADAAGDALDKLKAAADGLANTLTVKLSKSLTAIAGTATEGLKNINGVLSGKISANPYSSEARRSANLYYAFDPRSNIASSLAEQYKVAERMEIIAERERQRTLLKEKQAEIEKQIGDAQARVGTMLADQVAKTNALVAAEKERTKNARTLYWTEYEAARQARITAAETASRSVAETLVTEMMQEQESLERESELRRKRLAEMMANPGGAPTIMAGSAEEQLARFNAAAAANSVQNVAQRQLTIQERIDKELTRIRQKEEAMERLLQQVLDRFPVINPI
jgi:hypothetical protein